MLSDRVNALDRKQRSKLARLLEDRVGDRYLHAVHEGEKELILAFVTLSGRQAGDSDDIRNNLGHCLPQYMIPARVVIVDALPKTATGKIDHTALIVPEEDDQPTSPDNELSAPKNDLEATIADVWRDVLRTEIMDVYDDFFELGGDSILTIQAVARLFKHGIEISPGAFLDNPTVAAQALHIEQTTPRSRPHSASAGPAPLTPIQHWFFEQDFEDPSHWNLAVLLDVPEIVRPSHLKTALDHVANHHASLRSRFTNYGSSWQLTIDEIADTTVHRHVLVADTDANRHL